jgi:glycosyltransferase involved in cell wall biosynthesis
MAPGKSWLTPAHALRLLRDQQSLRASVTWVGSLEQLPRAYQQELQRIKNCLSEHQLDNQWHWLGRQAEVAPLMASHDALVHPSTQEGLPNVVCEALACGCPAVVSDTLDHPRLVQDGASGFLFAPGDAESLAAALMKLQQLDGPQRQTLGRAARQFAEEHLALPTCADRYESLLDEVVQARRGQP